MTDASGVTNYTYTNRDQVISKARPQGSLSYAYDKTGNVSSVLSSNANGTNVSYAWDANNRLPNVTDNRTNRVTSYTYDATNQMASMLYPNGVRHGFGFDNRTGTTINPFQYRGEQFDMALGMYYLRARYYAPKTGRFLTTDKFEGLETRACDCSNRNSATPAIGVHHLFGYANEDPVQFIDPSGYIFERALILGGSALGVVETTFATLAAGAAEYAAAAQLYFGVAYLTGADILAFVESWAYTNGVVRLMACAGIGYIGSQLIERSDIARNFKAQIGIAIGAACSRYFPAPGIPSWWTF